MNTFTCEVCDTIFKAKPSRGTCKFCSWKCTKAYRARGITIEKCAQCETSFRKRPSQPNQKYCSISCGLTARNLTDRNPSYNRDITGAKNPMFGKGLKGEANPMFGKRGALNPAWKGGRKIRKDGYVLVVAPTDHPFGISSGRGKSKYILEHRLVMERHLGRYLRPEEVVHHIDENPTNNDISNLRLYANQAEHISEGHG